MFWYVYISAIGFVFTTEGILEVAIESRPEWESNPQRLHSVQTLLTVVSYQAVRSTRVQSQVITATSISPFVQCSDFIFIIAFASRHIYHNRNLAQVIPRMYLYGVIH